MASITSVISLFIVLAVSCYSLPVEDHLATSTFVHEFTTGVTIVTNESAINMHLVSDDESTSLPIIQKIRALFEHGIDQVTTPVVEELHENVTFIPRMLDEVHENITVIPRTVVGDLFTTVETSTEFDQRAIRPQNVELVKESAVVILNGTEFESTTVVEPTEVTSSFTDFAQTTGLLPSNDSEVLLTTEELLTTVVPVESERLIKTVAIIPGEITETKIYPNVPIKPVDVADHVQQLSQGSTLLLFLLAVFLFCVFLMASVIAIVKSNRSLKKQSRIIEMEASLDKQHQYFLK